MTLINTEERLVGDIKRGDRKAMRQLFDIYSGYAMAIGLRYVPDRDDVLDIMQDSFIKIFQSINTFTYRGEGTLKAWISRIVANEALGFLRRNKRIVFTDEIPECSDEDNPDTTSITDDALASLIGQLPDGYRVVLNLYVFGELSHKEIAAKLGISASTSASQFFHAKKMLARLINEYNKKQNS